MNKFLLQTYAMAVLFNYWTDKSEDPFGKRVARAALNAVPMSLVIDTSSIIENFARKFEVGEIHQPANTFDSMRNVVSGITQQLNGNFKVVASHEEDTYKDK